MDTITQDQTPTHNNDEALTSNNPPPTANSEFEPKESSSGGKDPYLCGKSQSGFSITRNLTHDLYRVDKRPGGRKPILSRQRRGHPEDREDAIEVPEDTDWTIHKPAPISADGSVVACAHIEHPTHPGPSILGLPTAWVNLDATVYSVCTQRPEEVLLRVLRSLSSASQDGPRTAGASRRGSRREANGEDM